MFRGTYRDRSEARSLHSRGNGLRGWNAAGRDRSRWANPFPMTRWQRREEALTRFRNYLLASPTLRRDLGLLGGQFLCCHCPLHSLPRGCDHRDFQRVGRGACDLPGIFVCGACGPSFACGEGGFGRAGGDCGAGGPWEVTAGNQVDDEGGGRTPTGRRFSGVYFGFRGEEGSRGLNDGGGLCSPGRYAKATRSLPGRGLQ